jgi:outer membrane protein assembly factor BamB
VLAGSGLIEVFLLNQDCVMRFGPLMVLIGLLHLTTVSAEDWPQWRGPERNGLWREDGVTAKLPAELPRKWTAPLGPGYSGPTVANGRVYVTDRQTKPTEGERILCFDEGTGKPLWKVEYPAPYGSIGYQAGPRASVTVDDGLAFALGATGVLHCLDASSGEIRWKRDLAADYEIEMPIWGIAGAPLVYKDLVVLHIGGKEACVVALHRKTGEHAWKALNDRAQYTAPVLVKQAGKDVVLVWTGDSVAGVDAADGQVYWRYPWKPRNMPIGIATPVIEGDLVFFTSFYDGSLMLRLTEQGGQPAFEKVWQIAGRDERNTEALHSIISTPVMREGYIYGADSYGELRCLDAKTGERIWEDLTATPKARWSNIHFVERATGGKLQETWLFNERGELLTGQLSPKGFTEISRGKLIEPTQEQLRQRGGVSWSHPAFANRCVFIRNDKELVCASLAEPASK